MTEEAADATIIVELEGLDDLPEGEMTTRKAGEFDVLICRVEGQLHAVEDRCSHAETTLSDGFLDGHAVVCPLHSAMFDVRDGTHLCPPAFTGVPAFTVTEGPDGVTVEVPEKAAPPDPGFGGPGGMFETR